MVFIATGMLPFDQIFGAIDWNVLLMIAGTMGLVQLFIDSRMPARLADMIMLKVPNVQMAAVALALFAGIISAFVDNVATVLMVAPVALAICKSSRPTRSRSSSALPSPPTCRVRPRLWATPRPSCSAPMRT